MEEDFIGLSTLQNCYGYAIDQTRTYLDYSDWDSFGYVNVYDVSIKQTSGGTVQLDGYDHGLGEKKSDEEFTFTEGTQAKFSATPEDDYRLVGWNNGPELTVNAPEMVSAKFEKKKKDPDPPLDPLDKKPIDVRTSLDPQDMWGPAGYDAPGTLVTAKQRFVSENQALMYRVEVWNKPEALVPTQDATITDTLDPSVFDLSTFQFTRAGFLSYDAHVATQTLDIRLDAPDLGVTVRITGTINMQTGEIDWLFHAMDPLTGQTPTDPQVGFLPPYDPSTGHEIAWVEFSVKAKADLPTGSVVSNQAFTQFDYFGPLGPAPEAAPWSNTVDATPPVSAVLPLAATITTADFPVQWSGTDAGSGIVGYDVYVSTDGGAYALWQDDVAATSAIFHGQAGDSYAFYSAAHDGVGHVEAAPATADTATVSHIVATVGTLTTTPARPLFNAPITLTAGALTTGDDAPAAVQFKVTKTGGQAVDIALGTDSDGASGWSWSGSIPGLSAGTSEFQVRVQDAQGVWGEWTPFTITLYRTTALTTKPVTFKDSGGNNVTVSLTGGGTATLYFGATGNSDLAAIVCSQTKITSVLTITAPNRTTLGGLESDGPLGTVAASTTSLTGKVILAAGADPKVGVAMTFDRIADADFALSEPLTSLTATDWLDTDATKDWLRAPWIGALTTTGRVANATTHVTALAGDFQANVETAAAAFTSDTQFLGWTPLGTVSIAGLLDNDTFTVHGWNSAYVSITSLKAGGVGDASVTADGGIGTLTTSLWQNGAITAGRLATLSITKTAPYSGDFSADISLTGSFLGHVTLGKSGLPTAAKALGAATILGDLTAGTWDITGAVGTVGVTGSVGADGNGWLLKDATTLTSLTLGDVVHASVSASGALGTLNAKRWQAGSVAAGSLTTLLVPGAVKTATADAIPGDFLGDLTLSGQGLAATALTLTTANVAGGVGGGTWAVSGKVGTVTIGGTVGLMSGPWTLNSATTVASLTLADVQNGVVSVAGALAALTAKRWQAGSVTAASITSLQVTGAAKTATADAIPGDFLVGLTLTGQGLAAAASTLATANITGNVGATTWDVTGKVGSVTVAGTVGASGTPWVLKDATTVTGLTLGDVIDAAVTASGAIATVTAKRWQAGSLTAPSLTTLNVNGALAVGAVPAVSGDFLANLTLSGAGVAAAANTLGTATIKGNVGADTWDVAGRVGSVTVAGTVGTPGNAWTLKDATTVAGLTLGDVVDAAVTTGGAITTLTAKRWQAGAIAAPSLTTLQVTGAVKTATAAAIPGDFLAGLTLNGQGVTATASTLTTANITGNVGATTWDVTGKVGSVTVAGTVGASGNAWTLTHATTVAGLTLGDVIDGAVTTSGAITTLTAKRWQAGSITAPSLTTLNINGSLAVGAVPAVSGDFLANLTLSGAGVAAAANTLGTVNIKGNVGADMWDVAGRVGTVTAAGTVGASGNAWTLKDATTVTGLTLGDVIDGAVTTSGAITTLTAKRWQAGSITAPSLTTLNVSGSLAVGAVPAVSGDFLANLTLSGAGVTAAANTLGAATIKGNVGTSTWNVTGKAGALAVGSSDANWNATVTGAVASLAVSGNASGTIDVLSLASLAVKGSLTQAKLTLRQPVDTTNAAVKSLGTATITQWMDGAEIRAAGSIGAVTTGGMKNGSLLLAGVKPTVSQLTGARTDFLDGADNLLGSLQSLTVTGIAGAPSSMMNSRVAAWNLGVISLKNVQTVNGADGAFGLEGHLVTSYTRLTGTAVTDKKAATTGPAQLDSQDDFTARLI
jgi:hypothetical protein